MTWRPDLMHRHGGVMRIGRAFIIPAILALGATGSVVVGSAVPEAAAHTATVHTLAASPSAFSNLYYRACSGCPQG
jgi:hypothetical protein